jgi:hypothetical protein
MVCRLADVLLVGGGIFACSPTGAEICALAGATSVIEAVAGVETSDCTVTAVTGRIRIRVTIGTL